ncbi:MAG: hypothetical protein FWF60_09440 [Oscillospiraceae bacterium]|nr:hypothetical protein [Oscillospiraceae bacterium]
MELIFFALMYGLFAIMRWYGHSSKGRGDGKFESNVLVRIPRWLSVVLFLSRKKKKQPLWLVLPQILNFFVLPFLPWGHLAESFNTDFYHKSIPFYCQCAIFFVFVIFMLIDDFIFWRKKK